MANNRNSPGQGTIVQRKDGRWQASIMLNGKRRTVYGKTKAEAVRKLAQLRGQASSCGTLPDPGKRTVNDLLDLWLETAAPTLKPRTLANYNAFCNAYIRPTLGNVRLSRLSPDQLQSLYAHLQAQGHRRTAQIVHNILHRALQMAVLWRWLPENPADRVLRPSYRPRRKELWTAEELAAFLAGTREHWLHPLWVFLTTAGCRLGEALALRWEDVDLQAQAAHISRTLHRIAGQWVFTEPKTKSALRVITLPPEAISALRKQKAQQSAWRLRAGPEWQDHGLVFSGLHGQPMQQSVVNHALQRECARLGLPVLSAHAFRHMHASLLLSQGLPLTQVSRRLGHANTNITATIYAHALEHADEQAARAISRVLAAGGGG